MEDLAASPDEAFIRDDGKVAYVFDSERNEVLHLEGYFHGDPDEVARALRKAMSEQHPRVYDEE